jgi:hypothetical protein
MKKHALLWNMLIHHMHMCSTPWMSLTHWVKLEPKSYAQILDVKESSLPYKQSQFSWANLT